MPFFYETQLLGFSLANWVYFVTLCAAIMLVVLTGVAYTTLFERRVISALQVRVGPNRVGPLGLLQPIADGTVMMCGPPVSSPLRA